LRIHVDQQFLDHCFDLIHQTSSSLYGGLRSGSVDRNECLHMRNGVLAYLYVFIVDTGVDVRYEDPGMTGGVRDNG
jgi:hypothetical protein